MVQNHNGSASVPDRRIIKEIVDLAKNIFPNLDPRHGERWQVITAVEQAMKEQRRVGTGWEDYRAVAIKWLFGWRKEVREAKAAEDAEIEELKAEMAKSHLPPGVAEAIARNDHLLPDGEYAGQEDLDEYIEKDTLGDDFLDKRHEPEMRSGFFPGRR